MQWPRSPGAGSALMPNSRVRVRFLLTAAMAVERGDRGEGRLVPERKRRPGTCPNVSAVPQFPGRGGRPRPQQPLHLLNQIPGHPLRAVHRAVAPLSLPLIGHSPLLPARGRRVDGAADWRRDPDHQITHSFVNNSRSAAPHSSCACTPISAQIPLEPGPSAALTSSVSSATSVRTSGDHVSETRNEAGSDLSHRPLSSFSCSHPPNRLIA